MKKWVYIGIDQTGAVDRKGKPRPLPVCFIRNKTVSFFYLSQFSRQEMINQIQPLENEELVICVDCVFGLPSQLKLTWRKAMKRIIKYDGYGMQVAREYFRDIGKGKVLRREIEIACHANSVFIEKPFQKNIQTGTFRIWKDISFEENQFYAPALEKLTDPDQIKIFEGYPSLSWRLLFGSNTRQPSRVSEFLRVSFPLILFTPEQQLKLEQDPNLADALLLALTIKKFRKSAFLLKPSHEGWILGF
ncbi:MAG: hypothetical protein H7328_10660 [Bdellovibrio sp.]|nr:hypothetical protein [Bdellovibrio sp.]